MKKFLFLISITFLSGTISKAQCTFDPTVTGDTLLCPNSNGQLTTQVYDTYQWYKRPLFGGPAQAIPGATFQTHPIDAANDAAYYFSVEVTLNGCTELSPEVLVDGWAFLLPFTIIEGDYIIGGNGELILCQGDSILLIAGLPYDTNLQWYDNGTPVPNANNDTLIVTVPGSYTFSGAPAVCPNFVQTQFLPSDVTVINCPTGIHENNNQEQVLFPNPATDHITLKGNDIRDLTITDTYGRTVYEHKCQSSDRVHNVDISHLAPGIYFLQTGNSTQRFIRR